MLLAWLNILTWFCIGFSFWLWWCPLHAFIQVVGQTWSLIINSVVNCQELLNVLLFVFFNYHQQIPRIYQNQKWTYPTNKQVLSMYPQPFTVLNFCAIDLHCCPNWPEICLCFQVTPHRCWVHEEVGEDCEHRTRHCQSRHTHHWGKTGVQREGDRTHMHTHN